MIGWGCSDLTPDLGVTSTPVIDTATNTIYLDAQDLRAGQHGRPPPTTWTRSTPTTGAQRAGFPKLLERHGAERARRHLPGDHRAAAPRPAADGRRGLRRLRRPLRHPALPGLGLRRDATAGEIKARWSAVTERRRRGHLAVGRRADVRRAGRLFVSTGNGGSPVGPSDAPSGMYGESIVRLDVQADGTLKAKDFFAPVRRRAPRRVRRRLRLGRRDRAARRHLRHDARSRTSAVAVGKAGYVYLLNRDNLGGIRHGARPRRRRHQPRRPVRRRVVAAGRVAGRRRLDRDPDRVAQRRASIPEPSGSSGYLKLYRYRKAANGTPSLDAPIQSDDAFGFGSGAPVITSDGTTSGSATMWIVWAPNGSGPGRPAARLRRGAASTATSTCAARSRSASPRSSRRPASATGGCTSARATATCSPSARRSQAEVQATATTFPLTTVGETQHGRT